MSEWNRRQCLLALSTGLAASGLVGCTPSAPTVAVYPPVRWQLRTAWPARFPGLGQAAEDLAKLVKVLSQGNFQIDVQGAPAGVAPSSLFALVAQNAVQIGHAASYYWHTQLPAASFFTAVPFGFTAQQMNAWLQFGGGMTLWQALYQPFNVLPFQGGNTGAQMAGWFKKELHSLADIQGLKFRIAGIGADVWLQLGGEPVELAGDGLLVALQQGQVDAVEWIGPYADLAFGLHKAAPYYYHPGWQEPSAGLEFLVNRSAFDALPLAYQQIFEQACQVVNQSVLDEYTARNHASLEELVDLHHVQVRALPDDILQALRVASEKAVQQLARTSPLAERIYQSFKSFQQHTLAYQALAELPGV